MNYEPTLFTYLEYPWGLIQDFSKGGGANSREGSANLLFCKYFAGNGMKMKEIGPREWRWRPLGSATDPTFKLDFLVHSGLNFHIQKNIIIYLYGIRQSISTWLKFHPWKAALETFPHVAEIKESLWMWGVLKEYMWSWYLMLLINLRERNAKEGIKV